MQLLSRTDQRESINHAELVGHLTTEPVQKVFIALKVLAGKSCTTAGHKLNLGPDIM